MDEVHQQLLAVLNDARRRKDLPLASIDSEVSAVAQGLSDSILDSSATSDNDLAAGVAAFAAEGLVQVHNVVCLTGQFAVPDAQAPDYSATLEARVLDAAISLVTVGSDAPELLSTLMNPVLTHIGVGVAAHGEGRVRVVIAPLTHMARLVRTQFAQIGPRGIDAQMSSLEETMVEGDGSSNNTEEDEEGGADATAAKMTTQHDAPAVVIGSFNAEVAVSVPGWAIIGAQLFSEEAGAESLSTREQVFRIACNPSAHRGGGPLLAMRTLLFRAEDVASAAASSAGTSAELSEDAAASTAPLLQLLPWELQSCQDCGDDDDDGQQKAAAAAAHSSSSSPALRAILPVGITTALTEAMRRAGGSSASGSSSLTLYRLKVLLREVVDDDSGESRRRWQPIPYNHIDPEFSLLHASANDGAEADSEPSSRAGGSRNSRAASQGGAASRASRRSSAADIDAAAAASSGGGGGGGGAGGGGLRGQNSLSEDDEAEALLFAGSLGDAGGGVASAPGVRGRNGIVGGSAAARRAPRTVYGLEVLVTLMDDREQERERRLLGGYAGVEDGVNTGDGSLSARGGNADAALAVFFAIHTFAVLPVDGDTVSAAEEQSMPVDLQEAGTAMLPIALGAVHVTAAAAADASSKAASASEAAALSSQQPTAVGVPRQLRPIVHMLLVTGNSKEEALAQLPDGYEVATQTDLAALAHASVGATLESAAREASMSHAAAAASAAATAGGGAAVATTTTPVHHSALSGGSGLAPITACILLGIKREPRHRVSMKEDGEGGDSSSGGSGNNNDGAEGVVVDTNAWEPPVVDAALIVAANMKGAHDELMAQLHGQAQGDAAAAGDVPTPLPFPEFAVPEGYAAQVVDLLLPRDSDDLLQMQLLGGNSSEDAGASGVSSELQQQSSLLDGSNSSSVIRHLHHNHHHHSPIPVRFVLLHTTSAELAVECRASGMGVQIGGFEDEQALLQEGQGHGGVGGEGDAGWEDGAGMHTIGRDIRADAADAEAAAALRAALLERIIEATDEGEMLGKTNARLQKQLANYFAVRASTDESASTAAAAAAANTAAADAAALSATGGLGGTTTSLPPAAAAAAAPTSSYATMEKEKKYRELISAIAAECEVQATEQTQQDSKAGDLQRRLDEMGGRLRGIMHAFSTFKHEIGRTAANSRTGAKIEPAVLEKYASLEAVKDAELARMQLKHIHLTNQQAARAGRNAKEQIAEGLAVIDFEQLKIENSTLNEQIESRVEEINRLRKKTGGAVQVLTHVREKLHHVGGEAERLRAELRLVESAVSEQRRTLASGKLEREAIRAQNETTKAAQSFAHDPALVADFLARKKAVEAHSETVAQLAAQHAMLTAKAQSMRTQTAALQQSTRQQQQQQRRR